RRRALISVASLVPDVADTPLTGVAVPASAIDGSNAVSAKAATVASAAARPNEKTEAFRVNISMSSSGNLA
ncbi:MAG: hypothetical protein QOJ58_3870, partial [Alphaproteobacteria bacterium]|nr:hypothetical protein [Alphaproteobacteria bacterium]